MALRSDKAADLSCLASRYKNFFITNASSIIGAYKVGGVDHTGLGKDQRILCTALLRSLIQHSPPNMTFTQYYVHRDDSSVSIKPRSNKRSGVVSKRRELFLQNKRKLCKSDIYFLPELPFSRDLTKFATFDFMTNLFSYPVSKESRKYISTRISERNSILAYEDDIKEAARQLEDEIENHISRLDLTSFNNEQLEIKPFYGLIKALHTFDFSYLDMEHNPAHNNLNSRVFDSNIVSVNIEGIDYFKIVGIDTKYVRFASIKGFSDEYLEESMFGKGNKCVAGNRGNYVIMTRYRGLDRWKQEKYFKNMKDEVQRNQINPLDFISGNNKSALETQLMMSDKDKSVLNEVNKAMSLQDYHGNFQSVIAVFGNNIEEIKSTCKDIRASLNQSGIDLVWESSGIDSALESFLPGSQFTPKRGMILNSTKAAALSLFYKSSTGIPKWSIKTAQGERKEEAFYIFESNDGTPFYYTPYIGGKCMTIGIGPIRSGKTFTKNALATHFMKFGGLYTAIDIDPGTEAVAKFFQDDGSVFRLDDDLEHGFNPFYIAGGVDDKMFRAHFFRQLEEMASSNSSDELKRFNKDEQDQIDKAIIATLKLPQEMRSFSAFLDHCNKHIKAKLSRFFGDGMYANFYDNEKDAIGSLRRRLSVYNLMGVKDDPIALPLTMNEIFYRVIRAFENPRFRDYFKLLDIDEAHNFLKIPGSCEFLTSRIRTWGKWNAGVSLWTQSPLELQKLNEWPALRNAASTFWFMADGEMDRDVYRKTFNLTEGNLDAIEGLIPKQQAFIYQPEIKVAKVINIHAEPEQRVINTSVAGEAMTLANNITEYDGDIDKAIQKTIQDLNFS